MESANKIKSGFYQEKVVMKVERFIKEFANYQKKYVLQYDLSEHIMNDAIRKIDKAVQLREQGAISVNETILLIADCFVKE